MLFSVNAFVRWSPIFSAIVFPVDSPLFCSNRKVCLFSSIVSLNVDFHYCPVRAVYVAHHTDFSTHRLKTQL